MRRYGDKEGSHWLGRVLLSLDGSTALGTHESQRPLILLRTTHSCLLNTEGLHPGPHPDQYFYKHLG